MNSNKNVKISAEDPNAFVFALSPQAKLWNGQLAIMVAT
jgi:hypothetical protein